MLPVRFEILQQAKLDGLCGFYSILNALRYLRQVNQGFEDLPLKDHELFLKLAEIASRHDRIGFFQAADGIEVWGLGYILRQAAIDFDLPLKVATIKQAVKNADEGPLFGQLSNLFRNTKSVVIIHDGSNEKLAEDGHWISIFAKTSKTFAAFDSMKKDGPRRLSEAKFEKAFGEKDGLVITVTDKKL